jgi:hypothetical protein
MGRENGSGASLNKEDLVTILETVKNMGNSKKYINTEDFVKAIEIQLLRAMSKSKP